MGLVIGNENYSWTEFETNAEYKEGFDKELIGSEIVTTADFKRCCVFSMFTVQFLFESGKNIIRILRP